MNVETRLQAIGDELERAFAADLRAHVQTGAHSQPRRSRLATHRRRWLAAAGAIAVAAPAVAYAAGVFTSPQTVARTLPASDRIFGSKPTCTVVQPNVRYRCTLAKAPPADPIWHLTPRQWRKLLDAKVSAKDKKELEKYLAEGPNISPRDYRREFQLIQAARNKVLASFGYTPAQIHATNVAMDSGTAGIGPGRFKGTVEPTIDAGHHISGGCRAANADGTLWDCYLGQAAVKQKIVSGIGAYVPGGPGVG